MNYDLSLPVTWKHYIPVVIYVPVYLAFRFIFNKIIVSHFKKTLSEKTAKKIAESLFFFFQYSALTVLSVSVVVDK